MHMFGGYQQAGSQWGGAWGQQQAPAQQSNPDVILTVTGCTHGTVGPIVRGTFQREAENHGKPTYKRDGQVNGLDVKIYYWDDRDGPGFCGWWFGPVVGGDQVWAYHAEKIAALPPSSGWKVPYDGPVDRTFAIASKPKGGQPQAQAQQWGQKGGQQQKLQEQRQQLEALRQNQQAQNASRAGDMRAKQQADNAERIEAQKKKMEEMKVHQQALMVKRAEEQKKNNEEMEAKKLEQMSVLKIRQVMQKFRACSAEQYEEGKKLMDEILAKHLEACGSMKDKIEKECHQAIDAAKKRTEELAEAKKKEEEKKEAENQRRRDLRAKSAELLKQFEELVSKCEEAAKGVAEEAEPLSGEKALNMDEIEACGAAVEEAQKAASEKVAACHEFVAKEGAAIKNVPPIDGEPKTTAASDMSKLVARSTEAKKLLQLTVAKSKTAREGRIKKAHAKDKFEKSVAIFKKFDADKDGKLSRKEVQAFAKGAYGFTLPTDALDSIGKILINDSKGVDKSDFYRLKVLIGIARETSLDATRKKDKEAREKEIAALKQKLEEQIKSAGELSSKATEDTTKAEKQIVPLNAKAKTLNATEMISAAKEFDGSIEEARKSIKAATDAVVALKEETQAELKVWLTNEARKLEVALKALEPKLTKVDTFATKFKADASSKDAVELDKLRAKALTVIFHHQGAKKMFSVDLYQEFDKKKKGKVGEAEFLGFFKMCEKKKVVVEEKETIEDIAVDDLKRLFAQLDEDKTGFIQKEQFMNVLRRFMKVVRASVLTEDASIKSKPVRRLIEGEVLEALTGPIKEEGAEVARIKVKATSDDVEGWVTPVGTSGTTFLQDGGNTFKVVKETILTGSFVIGADKGSGSVDRKLKVGEVVEVREWPKKEEGSGLMRMKVRVKGDGKIGWATSVGNTGIPFLESC